MPQIIPMIVTAITTVTSAVVAAGPLAVAAFNAANVIGAAALAGAAFQAIQPDVKSSSTSIEWNADPNAPNRFAFGRIGGAGNIIHNATYGPDKMYVGFVGVMSASGPIKGWAGFKADDAHVSFNGAGMAINSEYANEMWVGRQRGLQPEPAYLPSPSGLKHGAAMPRWGSSYKLSGKAAYIYTLSENSKRSAYKGKVPTGIHIVEGLYCYDPRYDNTYPGGAGGCRLDDPTTWVYSTNAYIHGLNWAIGRWEGQARGISPARYGVPYASMKVGGIGARPDGIDFAAYVEAANVFDENGWACAAWPDADQSKAAVLDSFLQAGGGIYAERQGKISCMHRAAPRTSIATITADDTAGTIEYDTTTSILERINTIRPEYWSEAHGWQMVATDEVTAEAWRLEDGQGEPVTRSKGIAYNYVPQSKQSRELAALQASHTREPIRGTAPLRHYLDLEVGDCFTFAVPEAVLNGQKVIVLNVDPDLENDIIHVTFASETDGKYPFAFGQADAPPPMPGPQPADNTVTAPLPDDWEITPRPPGSGGVQVPIIDIVGEVSNSTATAVHFEWTYDNNGVPSADWISAGIWPPTVKSISVPADPGSWIWIGASYLRGENFSERQPYGPVRVPALISDDTTHLNGEPVQDILDKLTDVETLSESNALAVADLDGRVDDTITAAEAAIAAGEAANLAVLKAGEAGDAATASNVAAGIATTKAEEAGSHATAANASKLAADASRDDAASSASASVLSAAQADAAAGEAGDWAAASEGSAVQAGAHAADGLAYRNQAVDARDGAVAASLAAGTSASAAQDAEESAQAEAAAAQNAAATAITQASNADAAASSAQISANLAAKSGVQNEWDNADLSQGSKGFTQQWGGSSGAIVIDNWSGSRLTARKAGGGLQEPSMVSMGSVEFGGGPFSAERTIYNMRSWRVAAGERIGIAFDARDESAAAGGAPARWAIVVRIFNNDGSVWGGVPNSDFQSTYGSNQWHRVGRVFTIPVDGYLTVEAYLQSQGTPSTTVVLGARHFVFARMRPDATDIPAYSAPAGGGALSEISTQLAITAAVAANTADQVGSARFNVTGGAGGDPFDVSLEAGPDGSDASFTATKIRLRNMINGQAVDALTVEGGKAKFSGELAVQSGASGERTVITTNAVRVFDAGNVERVTLGRW